VLFQQEKGEKIACGINHTLVLTASGKVYSFGSNQQGQLGTGSKKSHLTPCKVYGLDNNKVISVEAGYHSAALTFTGELYIWGTTVLGEYLIPQRICRNLENMIVDVKIGDGFTMILDIRGYLWGFGCNQNGELGLGETLPHNSIVRVKSLKGTNIKMVGCGRSFVIASGNQKAITEIKGRDDDKSVFNINVQKISLKEFWLAEKLDTARTDRSGYSEGEDRALHFTPRGRILDFSAAHEDNIAEVDEEQEGSLDKKLRVNKKKSSKSVSSASIFTLPVNATKHRSESQQISPSKSCSTTKLNTSKDRQEFLSKSASSANFGSPLKGPFAILNKASQNYRANSTSSAKDLNSNSITLESQQEIRGVSPFRVSPVRMEKTSDSRERTPERQRIPIPMSKPELLTDSSPERDAHASTSLSQQSNKKSQNPIIQTYHHMPNNKSISVFNSASAQVEVPYNYDNTSLTPREGTKDKAVSPNLNYSNYQKLRERSKRTPAKEALEKRILGDFPQSVTPNNTQNTYNTNETSESPKLHTNNTRSASSPGKMNRSPTDKGNFIPPNYNADINGFNIPADMNSSPKTSNLRTINPLEQQTSNGSKIPSSSIFEYNGSPILPSSPSNDKRIPDLKSYKPSAFQPSEGESIPSSTINSPGRDGDLQAPINSKNPSSPSHDYTGQNQPSLFKRPLPFPSSDGANPLRLPIAEALNNMNNGGNGLLNFRKEITFSSQDDARKTFFRMNSKETAGESSSGFNSARFQQRSSEDYSNNPSNPISNRKSSNAANKHSRMPSDQLDCANQNMFPTVSQLRGDNEETPRQNMIGQVPSRTSLGHSKKKSPGKGSNRMSQDHSSEESDKYDEYDDFEPQGNDFPINRGSKLFYENHRNSRGSDSKAGMSTGISSPVQEQGYKNRAMGGSIQSSADEFMEITPGRKREFTFDGNKALAQQNASRDEAGANRPSDGEYARDSNSYNYGSPIKNKLKEKVGSRQSSELGSPTNLSQGKSPNDEEQTAEKLRKQGSIDSQQSERDGSQKPGDKRSFRSATKEGTTTRREGSIKEFIIFAAPDIKPDKSISRSNSKVSGTNSSQNSKPGSTVLDNESKTPKSSAILDLRTGSTKILKQPSFEISSTSRNNREGSLENTGRLEGLGSPKGEKASKSGTKTTKKSTTKSPKAKTNENSDSDQTPKGSSEGLSRQNSSSKEGAASSSSKKKSTKPPTQKPPSPKKKGDMEPEIALTLITRDSFNPLSPYKDNFSVVPEKPKNTGGPLGELRKISQETPSPNFKGMKAHSFNMDEGFPVSPPTNGDDNDFTDAVNRNNSKSRRSQSKTKEEEIGKPGNNYALPKAWRSPSSDSQKDSMFSFESSPNKRGGNP